MNSEKELLELAKAVGTALESRHKRVTTVESCTGGWISKALTDVAGSSAWFEVGFVTYGNKAKQRLVDVSPDTLREHGAVSEATVLEMATGGLARSEADIAVAVSGIAGPDGGSPSRPVGTVWFAWAWRDADRIVTRAQRALFAGDRDAVRRQSVAAALKGVLAIV